MMTIKNLLSFQWWNERVVDVYEGYGYEWKAPRWYIIVVVLAYLTLFGLALHGAIEVYNA